MLCLVLRLSTRRYPHLLLSADACSTAPAPVDRYLLPQGAQQQTLVAAVDRWNRQTDGRTDARSLHRPCTAYYAGSVINGIDEKRPNPLKTTNANMELLPFTTHRQLLLASPI